MKVLIMGGTRFLGRHIVDAALAANHEVTLFNRGVTNPDLYPQLETITGDRDSDTAKLKGRKFDAVIDVAASFPRQVQAVVDALDGAIEHYTFVSTCSTYADQSVPHEVESAATLTVAEPSVEELAGPRYGGFKALCEQTAEQMLPGRVHHVRSGLLVGPHDNTERFTYWVRRMLAGGDILVPGPKSLPVQVIDVRDVAEWCVRGIDNNVTGVFNAMGTPDATTSEDMYTAIFDQTATARSVDASLHWVDEEFLVEHDVKPWQELPVWIPTSMAETHGGFMRRSNAAALAAGMTLRPFSETAAATVDYALNHPVEITDSTPGLRPDHEAELLAAWAERSPR